MQKEPFLTLKPEIISSLTRDLPKIIEYAKAHLLDDDLHGLGHVIRVINNSKLIAEQESVSLILVEILGWLHDIGRMYESEKKKNHAIISSEMAIRFLDDLGYSQSSLKFFENAILSHSFSLNVIPRSTAALILRDSDRLDAIGAVGVYRACTYSFKNKTGFSSILSHIDEKLLKLMNTLETETGRKIAKKRHDFIESFKQHLLKELGFS